ncbi:hypothetical protein FRB95_013289 [Tulasnella sp. JGI-2019a]|nr:hypothetical protein FRB95_013289 [Tulasnella sp. JGI-2019a]
MPFSQTSQEPWSILIDVATYIFPLDIFDGPMEDQATGNVTYVIASKSKFAGQTTTITHADRSSVGAISWGSAANPMVVTLRGRTLPGNQMLVSTKPHIFAAPKQAWKDDWGNEYFWKDGLCYDAKNEVIARYTPAVLDTFRKARSATLSVVRTYDYLFDKIFFTALIVERMRRQGIMRELS